MDLYSTPAFLMKYKIQPEKNVPLSPAKYMAVIRRVLFNQLLGIPAGMSSFALYSARSPDDLRRLPSLGSTLQTILICIVCHDIFFYYAHSNKDDGDDDDDDDNNYEKKK